MWERGTFLHVRAPCSMKSSLPMLSPLCNMLVFSSSVTLMCCDGLSMSVDLEFQQAKSASVQCTFASLCKHPCGRSASMQTTRNQATMGESPRSGIRCAVLECCVSELRSKNLPNRTGISLLRRVVVIFRSTFSQHTAEMLVLTLEMQPRTTNFWHES